MFGKRRKLTRLEKVQQAVAGQVQLTSAQVQELLKRVPEQVQNASDHVQEALKHVPLDKVGNKIGEVRDGAGQVAAQAAGRALEGLARVAPAPPGRGGRDKHQAPPPRDNAAKVLWLLAGLIGGVLLGLLLAPESGRRTRALLRDQLNKKGHGLADLGTDASGKLADLGRKAKGAAAEVVSRAIPGDTPDDATLADQVRSALGRNAAVQSLPRLNIDSSNGVITVRGPMADEAVQATIAGVVRAVPGVVDVKMDLLLDDTGENEAFVG